MHLHQFQHLFLIYISDLFSVLDPDTTVRLFTGDYLVYRSVCGAEDQRKLQQDLNALSLWGIAGDGVRCLNSNMIHMGNAKLQFFTQPTTKFYNLYWVLCTWVLPSHTNWASPSTLPLLSVRPTNSSILSSVISVEVHTSARRPPTLPRPDPSWNTVPSFGILSSSATLTSLRSYRWRTLDGREASMVPPVSCSSSKTLIALLISDPECWSVSHWKNTT